jgi:hypothetical protein
MKRIDVLACILGATMGFVGLAILDAILRIHAHYGDKARARANEFTIFEDEVEETDALVKAKDVEKNKNLL